MLIFWAAALQVQASGFFHAGPLFDEFDLTLTLGTRTEALGPLYYQQQTDEEHIWGVPPLLSYTHNFATDFEEFDFLYPVMTYDRYGTQYRWQFFQLLNFAGGPTQHEDYRQRFGLFPIYFHQRSSDPKENCIAVGPFYGHLKNHLFRDEIFFVMFPLFSETKKKDLVTDNYLYPIFHLRHGENLTGWQFWPVIGHEHKDVTTRTNGFGDTETIGGHDRWFLLWPLLFKETSGLGTANPSLDEGFIPLLTIQRSPQRDATTVIWPFFSVIDDRDKKYREWDVPWPLWVFARGEGKTTTRIWPFYSQAHTPTLESDFYLWPIYKYNAVHAPPLDRRRHRILFFLYSHLATKSTETGVSFQRTDLWPLFTHRKEFDGSTRLQILAILEPFVPGSHKVERDYGPVYSLWRSEKNAKTGATSQSLLWNLYRREGGPSSKKCSLLFGLFQYQSDSAGKSVRLFYIPVRKAK